MLGAHLLVLVLRICLLSVALDDVLAKVKDGINQIHIVAHNENVVGFMDLIFNFKSLLQRGDGVLEELLLIVIFLLDVGVDVPVFGLLILNEVEETLVHSDLELLMVICVLDHLVNCIFEVVDSCLVVADDVSVGFY